MVFSIFRKLKRILLFRFFLKPWFKQNENINDLKFKKLIFFFSSVFLKSIFFKSDNWKCFYEYSGGDIIEFLIFGKRLWN